MKLLLALALATISLSAEASSGARFSCLGHSKGATIYLEGDLVSSLRIDHVMLRVFSGRQFRDSRDRLDGVREAGAETHFNFHTGNTSTFLLLPDSQLGGVRAMLSASSRQLHNGAHEPLFSFGMQYVFEGYEQGGFRDITNLTCGPKSLGE